MKWDKGESPQQIFKARDNTSKPEESYCESCFCILKKVNTTEYRHFTVCKSCAKNLRAEAKDGIRRATPSLNDLLDIQLKYKDIRTMDKERNENGL